MKAKASATAQKLLNLYRQAHVIIGGWAAVNQVFVDEATDEVLKEMVDLPTGKMLAQHIQKLRAGETPMNSIARELLPYGGMMDDNAQSVNNISAEDIDTLISAIENFEPNQDELNKFMDIPIVRNFGSEWITEIKNILSAYPDTLKKFDMIARTSTAYSLWDSANDIINHPLNDRTRAQLQVDMPEYETYLPMFGDEGKSLLNKLHTMTSSLPHQDINA